MKKFKIYFDLNSSLKLENLRKSTGHTDLLGIIEIIQNLELEVNPRESKKNKVTNQIIKDLEANKLLFPFKNKGLLISANYSLHADKEVEIHISESQYQGIIDGGHTTYALGIYILKDLGYPEITVNNLKTWKDLKKFWTSEYYRIKKLYHETQEHIKNLYIPIELISLENTQDNYREIILDISSARNTNAQLKYETLVNQSGFFDPIKKILDPEVSSKINWKTNSSGFIDVRFLISILWAPLGMAELPYNINPISGSIAYSSKQTVISRYFELMQTLENKDEMQEIFINSTSSAFILMNDFLRIHDTLTNNFIEYFEQDGRKIQNYQAFKSGNNLNFFDNSTLSSHGYSIPQGFLLPIIYGMRGLLENNEGNLKWITDPLKFIEDPYNNKRIFNSVNAVMELSNGDPQKVGKNQFSYKTVENKIRLLSRDNGLSRASYEGLIKAVN